MRLEVLENVRRELHAGEEGVRLQPPTPRGPWAEMLKQYGLPFDATESGGLSIGAFYENNIRLGRYFSHEIVLPLRVYADKPHSREKVHSGYVHTMIEKPDLVPSATGNAGDSGFLPLKNLSAAKVPKDVWMKLLYVDVSKAEELFFSSEDLRRVFHFLGFDTEPTIIKDGRKTYLSEAAVLFNASKAVQDLSTVAQGLWAATQVKLTLHPLYNQMNCMRIVTGALGQAFEEEYGCQFPWTPETLLNKLRNDSRKKYAGLKESKRRSFMVEPEGMLGTREFTQKDSPTLVQWKDDDCTAPGSELHFYEHIGRRVHRWQPRTESLD